MPFLPARFAYPGYADMRIALTDRFVAGAKAATRAEFFDSRVTGLSLRVSPTAKNWAFHFTTASGKRARLTLGGYPAITLAGARGLALEAQTAVQAGQDPRTHKAGAMTLAALIESFLAKHVRPNLRSAKQVERRLRKNVLPLIGNVQLADLHRRDVNRVLDQVMGRGRPIEANRVFGDVRALLRWAVARGDLDRDPMQGMTAPSPARSRDRVLSDTEIAQLWHVLPTVLSRQIDCRRVLKLCLITGQRVGEVAGMRRDELDLSAHTWSLAGARTKNGHPHSVPLSDLAMSIIEEALAGAGDRSRLFALLPVAVTRFVERADFGIPHWTPHDLRRTALTQMAALGVEPVVLGHVANHRSATRAGITLSIYVKHSYDAEKRRALELWADRLAAIVGGTGAGVVPLRGRHA
jgi:integrase